MIRIYGTSENETWNFVTEYPVYSLHMGSGADAVIDRTLADSNIFGGLGNDILQTYAGNDRLHGEGGRDTFFIENTGDRHRVEIWGGRNVDSALIESDSPAFAQTVLDNGDTVIGFYNGTIVTLHGVEDIHVVTHGETPVWA